MCHGRIVRYDIVGLPGLNADDYLGLSNPLAPAVSALMKPSRLGKVAQKFQSLLAMARSGVDEARLALLTNVVETYLKLDNAEQANFKALTATPEGKEIEMVVSVYEVRGIEKGKRETLLRLIELKFRSVQESIRVRLEAITDIDELDGLLDTIYNAQSIEEIWPVASPE